MTCESTHAAATSNEVRGEHRASTSTSCLVHQCGKAGSHAYAEPIGLRVSSSASGAPMIRTSCSPTGGSRRSRVEVPAAPTNRRNSSLACRRSIRAGRALVTRKAWSTPSGSVTYVPGRAKIVRSPHRTTTSPSRSRKSSSSVSWMCRGGEPPGGTVRSMACRIYLGRRPPDDADGKASCSSVFRASARVSTPWRLHAAFRVPSAPA
jgi:hypothetical protein